MSVDIGLDVGTSAVRAVRVSTRGRGPAVLEKLGQVKLPAGAVRDGEVVDGQAVTDAIRQLWGQFKLGGKKVALGVANQQVVVRQVDLPYLPVDELRQSLQFQAQEYIPIAIDQAILDFHVLENYEGADGAPFSRILLVAAQQGMVEQTVECVRKAKLDPVLVDLDAFALLRSLAPADVPADGQGELIIDVGAAVTNVVVHSGGAPLFVRTVLVGGDAITDQLVNQLGMAPEEAEKAKAVNGVMDTSPLRRAEDEAIQIIAERANRFVDEIRSSLDYYNAQADALPVGRVVLTGGGGQLPNLLEQLANALGLPVEPGHPMRELKIGKTGLATEQLVEAEPYLAVAIGLALGPAA